MIDSIYKYLLLLFFFFFAKRGGNVALTFCAKASNNIVGASVILLLGVPRLSHSPERSFPIYPKLESMMNSKESNKGWNTTLLFVRLTRWHVHVLFDQYVHGHLSIDTTDITRGSLCYALYP